MKLKITQLVALVSLVLSISCQSQPAEVAKLDIKEYLSLTQGDDIYPTAEQVAMLESLVPDDTYSPFPDIDNRQYWDAIAATKDGQALLAEAKGMIAAEPEVPISDELYRRANKEGNRAIYKPRYYNTMDKLEKFTLAECIENKGNFLEQIQNFSLAIMQMKSWVHPNHDDAENGVLEGRRVSIDLGARKFGLVLSLVDITLKDRLDSGVRSSIRQNTKRRVIDTYLESCKGEGHPRNNTWIRATSNWNSVCTSGSLFTIITMSKDKAERVGAIGSAINSMKYYMSGFGEDGYCSEGLGYWNYGFGHYLYLAEIIYDYTDGKVDLFEFDNPEKMVAVANFPANYEIHNKCYAPFSDGVFKVAEGNDNFAYLLSARQYGSRKPSYFMPNESVFTVIGWRDAEANVDSANSESLALSTYFDDCGIIISRGAQQKKFSVAIKAGHNGENHNHNDVGSYFVLLEDDIVAGDIGAPSYTAGAFSPNNPARSSWGHPVPRINNTLQSSGKKFKGEVISTEFTEGFDVAKINLLPAYEIPALTMLERTMKNDRSGAGVISITDEFKSSEPVTFGTSVMVNVDYKISGNTIILSTGSHKVKVVVTAEGGKIALKDEVVPVKNLRSGRKSYRIGVDFTQPLTSGSIKVEYMPL